MLHIVFYSKIGAEQGQFTIPDMIMACVKSDCTSSAHLWRCKVDDEEDVKRNWEKLKMKEGKTSVWVVCPKDIPSMVKAIRIQEKAKQVGFEWENKEQVFEKIEEEINELKEVVQTAEQEKIEEELGDVFFSLVNYARFLQLDADNALERTNQKFIRRLTQMEQEAMSEGKQLVHMSLEEMDGIWNRIKQKNREAQ